MASKQNVAMPSLIDRHLTMLRAEGYSPRTIEDRERILRKLEVELPFGILHACREQLQQWLANDEWSRWSRYTYCGHLLGFYPWLVEHLARQGFEMDDPTEGLRRPKAPRGVPRPASEAQIAVALTAPEPLKTAVLLGLYGGLRRFEAAAAHREHITEELILIPVAKGGAAQTVPTHPAIWDHVRGKPAGPLITLSAQRLGQYAHRWFTRAGMRGFGLHQLRHYFGTTIQREYGDLRVTQECLRHRSIASTQVYTLVTPAQRAAAIAVVSPGLTQTGRDPQIAG